LRFGVFGPLRLLHDLAEAIQQRRGSVRVAELVLDHREEGHVSSERFAELFGIQLVRDDVGQLLFRNAKINIARAASTAKNSSKNYSVFWWRGRIV